MRLRPCLGKSFFKKFLIIPCVGSEPWQKCYWHNCPVAFGQFPIFPITLLTGVRQTSLLGHIWEEKRYYCRSSRPFLPKSGAAQKQKRGRGRLREDLTVKFVVCPPLTRVGKGLLPKMSRGHTNLLEILFETTHFFCKGFEFSLGIFVPTFGFPFAELPDLFGIQAFMFWGKGVGDIGNDIGDIGIGNPLVTD